MKILQTNQYNQGIGKYKLLSSTAGVGSIITTKIGYYILVSDINKWRFVQKANGVVNEVRSENNQSDWYKKSRSRLENRGITFVNDKRFVEFLKLEKDLKELVCLIGIPNIALNEHFNTPNWKNHPIRKVLELLGEETTGRVIDYMIMGTHFPKWFKNDKGDLKEFKEWLLLWIKNNRSADFVPPRDFNCHIRDIKTKDIEGKEIVIPEYKQLEQTNMVLICPDGHLSDIPWPRFLKWKTEIELRIRDRNIDKGGDLFLIEKCCTSPKLRWTESKTKSEGYASIFIECLSCGLGSGKEDNPKINLEGITNLKPNCNSEKPWEIELNQKISSEIPRDTGDSRCSEHMQIALVTGNNVYYASGFSSLFIPQHLAENKSSELIESLILLEEKYQKYFIKINITKENFWNNKFDAEDFIVDNGFKLTDEIDFIAQLKHEFFKLTENRDSIDQYELYRWQEYQCFTNNSDISDIEENKGLSFKNIKMPAELSNYFTKIQQIDELKVTLVQLDFNRVKPKERVVVNGVVQQSAIGKSIYSIEKNELFVLPANETYGEGLFFQFNEIKIEDWIIQNRKVLDQRFNRFFEVEPDLTSQGASTKQKIYNNRYKHFLIHTFSHILMRELEFSCGYPTASLKERLYISERMSGVLIYTSEGSEGSMGGLVWQGESDKILNLIKNGLERSVNCSSDPLCWESDGQGIFDLNLASCFSCSLVSETACEEMNLGLDRRVLVDDEFGFFQKIFENI